MVIHMKSFIKNQILLSVRKSVRRLVQLLRWLLLATGTGFVVGSFSTLFAYCIIWVTNYRQEHPLIILGLPFAGLVIVLIYRLFNYANNKGTNLVLSTIHAESDIPFKMAPLIFVTTLLTHLFGGSAGREGAALQLGGSIGNQLGRWLHLDEEDMRVLIMCGMSAAFSALFGTPMAAAIFSMEVVSVGVMYYAALVPCVFSSLIASNFAINLGIRPENFVIEQIPKLGFATGGKMILLALACAGISALFCMLLHGLGDVFREHIENPYKRIFFAGVMIVLLSAVFCTQDYLGAGIPLIERAMDGKAVWYAFLLKMLFTALTLEAGYKGGEIVPAFCVGATLGCLIGHILHMSPSLCAATGMIALFCGVTNCPVTSILIAFELFGFEGVPYFLIAVSISYLMSGYHGLYQDQSIIYSKYKAKYINKKTR